MNLHWKNTRISQKQNCSRKASCKQNHQIKRKPFTVKKALDSLPPMKQQLPRVITPEAHSLCIRFSKLATSSSLSKIYNFFYGDKKNLHFPL